MIYNSRNYTKVLNYKVLALELNIYNSRNYTKVLNEEFYNGFNKSTIVEIILRY